MEEIACFGKNNERNKSEAMESKSSLYVFRKSRFFDQAKGPCERNLRKRFELCVVAARFGAQTKTRRVSISFFIYLDQCSIFILERNVLNISISSVE